jgi:hypothetical protein
MSFDSACKISISLALLDKNEGSNTLLFLIGVVEENKLTYYPIMSLLTLLIEGNICIYLFNIIYFLLINNHIKPY